MDTITQRESFFNYKTSFKFSLLSICCLIFIMLLSSFTFGQSADFRQAANDRSPDPLGTVYWINGILQQNNSKYTEGMATLQRIILEDVPVTAGNLHTLRVKMETDKNGHHAYDFMVGWDDALAIANMIDGGQDFLPENYADATLNICGDAISATAETACNGATFSYDAVISGEIDYPIPGDANTTPNVISNFQSVLGNPNRTMQIRGNAIITDGYVSFVKYDAGYIFYDISWVSTSDDVVLEFAGHISPGTDPLSSGMGWGEGFGAADINGGPYHVIIEGFTTGEGNLGAMDNQLKGADILLTPVCSLPPVDDVCEGADNIMISATVDNGDSPQYVWSVDNSADGTNATIAGGQGTDTVEINIGTIPGTITVNLEVTNNSGDGLSSIPCSTSFTVFAEPTADAGTDQDKCQGDNNTTQFILSDASATNYTSILWNWTPISGDAAVTVIANPGVINPTVTVTGTGEVKLTLSSFSDPNKICPDAFDDVILTIIPNPEVDPISPVTACDSYELPAITGDGNYYTATMGGGEMLEAGDVISSTQTIYVYAETGTDPNCYDEESFLVTINDTPEVDPIDPVTACDSYELPAITGDGNYYTDTMGGGEMLEAGDVISSTQTIYVYAETGTDPNCYDEESFLVTINDTPEVDPISPVTACDSYELPAITGDGNYYTATMGGGEMLEAGDVISSTQTIYVYAETGTDPNCYDEESFLVTINDTPEVDPISPVTACDSYELPAITGDGNYYTDTMGGGEMLEAGDVISSTQTIYVYAETGTDPNCYDEESFLVTINDTPEVDPISPVTACDSYELPAITGDGNYYTATMGGGEMLEAGDVISSTQTIYVYAETGTDPNCYDEESFLVTINDTPEVDPISPVTACDSYELPAITGDGNYYTDTMGGGEMLEAGDVISSTQTIYVYAETGTDPNCYDEESFLVTINDTPEVDPISPVTACDSYELPAITGDGNYYTATMGGGEMLEAGDVISSTQTIYVYAETGTDPNCYDEESFLVTINDTPEVDPIDPVTACDSYELPAITGDGNYYTDTMGGGEMLEAGDVISSTQTIYVYAETGTDPNCYDEESFLVTINDTPEVDPIDPVKACESYELPAITGDGNYYTATMGGGEMLEAGDVISSTQTIYVYAETGTDPNCYDEESFIITIYDEPTVDAGNDQAKCQGDNNTTMFNVTASPTNYSTVLWEWQPVSGDAAVTLIANTNSLSPTVTVTGVGEVKLIVEAFAEDGSPCPNATDEVILMVTPVPIVTTNPLLQLCEDPEGEATFNLWNAITDYDANLYYKFFKGDGSGNKVGDAIANPAAFISYVVDNDQEIIIEVYNQDPDGGAPSRVAAVMPLCSSSASTFLRVNELPEITFLDLGTYCLDDARIMLSASPEGGTFSGNGVVYEGDVAYFDPSLTEPGVHVITYTVTDGNQCTNSATATVTTEDCCEDETAFAFGGPNPVCFSEISNVSKLPNRWGWTNELMQGEDYSLNLYAAAGAGGQCINPDKGGYGILVGTVSVSYNQSGDMEVTYQIVDNSDEYDFKLGKVHLYVGCFETAGKLSPGKYPFKGAAEDEMSVTLTVPKSAFEGCGESFYLIGHAEVEVCNDYTPDDEVLRTTTSSSPLKTFDFKAYPVPFKDNVTVEYKFDYSTEVTIEVMDIKGALVKSVSNNYKEGSLGKSTVDLSRVSDQLLFVKLSTDRESRVKKIISRE
ncbi:T9SS type A sorting domain-containing protein [Aegicerativicinus sediminis]|uniref:T9SS type A sorting domain-containing protein n=1 Tax=Aegicerativicinus sediminis TaxID=2893202 RepID=UPI001E33352C|nr:T9SS type A sorting domain-containing protein [Aegicerativicinus sediminis]